MAEETRDRLKVPFNFEKHVDCGYKAVKPEYRGREFGLVMQKAKDEICFYEGYTEMSAFLTSIENESILVKSGWKMLYSVNLTDVEMNKNKKTKRFT